jgi:hypothetical protein
LKLSDKIFQISSEQEFNDLSIKIFNFQYENNSLYRRYCNLIKTNPIAVKKIDQIPFLPISFFKSHTIKTSEFKEEAIFYSSGTTSQIRSKHYVKEIGLYEKSFKKTFRQFYGEVSDYCILALLPSYIEREGSSLIYMVENLISESNHHQSGFYLNNHKDLIKTLEDLELKNQKIILFGVSFALLDLAEQQQLHLKNTIVIETGGMKGRRKELTRDELHAIYKDKLGVSTIHSEYGMTELLSQAYSLGDGVFTPPNWMKILVRDINDPFDLLSENKIGGINVIDLANIYSCCFVSTQDLGRLNQNNKFEIIGRFDNSDLRGCNLLIS